jgi:hypothetical protein
MKTAITMAVLAAMGLMAAGCGTVKPVDSNAWAKDYYNQPNTASIASIEGENVEFSIKGAKRIVLNTPVPPKSIIPRDPGVLGALGGLFGDVVPWVAGAYIGGKLAERPATVQSQVVRPEVIEVSTPAP